MVHDKHHNHKVTRNFPFSEYVENDKKPLGQTLIAKKEEKGISNFKNLPTNMT